MSFTTWNFYREWFLFPSKLNNEQTETNLKIKIWTSNLKKINLFHRRESKNKNKLSMQPPSHVWLFTFPILNPNKLAWIIIYFWYSNFTKLKLIWKNDRLISIRNNAYTSTGENVLSTRRSEHLDTSNNMTFLFFKN